MTKRERLEDLGVIFVKLQNIIEEIENEFHNLLSSKHCFEEFLKKYNNEDGLDEIHRFLRMHLDRLNDVWCLARGDDE